MNWRCVDTYARRERDEKALLPREKGGESVARGGEAGKRCYEDTQGSIVKFVADLPDQLATGFIIAANLCGKTFRRALRECY